MKKYLGSCALVAIMLGTAGVAVARDQVKVVGSSTVFPYSQAVAEEFANKSGKTAPVVESTGTGGGFKAFCGGVGEDFADVTGASRAIKESEVKLCADNGVTDITEAMIGYDGLSIAVSRSNETNWDLTEEQIFKALAAELPDGKGGFVANPNKKWSDIDASLPDTNIVAFGPPPTSGTRDAFVELVMHDGCKDLPGMADLKKADEDKWNEVCSRMRQDGPFVEAGENDNLIVQRLESDPNSVGIFGYSFLYENSDKLKDVKINGVEVTFDTIADGSYPVARPLFVYIKNAHRDVIPGMKEFLEEFVSDAALGPDGYLAERGLTPLADDKRMEVQKAVSEAKKLGS
ncbi:substrate-binding domain-containing protein [Sinorhizobium meliloti]|uniref:substrate-binding domain-containing protein n=1 Tax=Rhizobium meliloti TaxID=382 RepID=UPI000FD8EDA6|nr:substrate-binding domain-containing protein [Sinorhizobium meliloti]RVH01342.1 phosphate ABC transporter substrate-binding protein [Sinorhizobium meliloti]RVH11547.1 phosphate ABC transporter substrate-binding protein [Sinorhizobium meliloti]RVH53173.1 phosphate ABC transporter substrate-binding protein [Sinorhizobium meliloti]RVI55260.1 phosphate ABC transporter substrate-binding protein [Sinorhizobium meliloti]